MEQADCQYREYTELGFHTNNIRIAVRFPNIKLRRPRFWRRKQKISSSSTSSVSSLSSAEDWIRDFHARYNPLQVEPLTSTPARLTAPARNRLTAPAPVSPRINL